MKRLTGFLALILILTLFSCKAIKKLGQFYINYNTEAVFPANIPVNIPATIYSPSIPTNSEQVFKTNSTNKDLIQSIKLDQMSLKITSPSGQNFSFLQNISIYISTDSLPEVLVASKQTIPADIGDSLALDVNPVELQSYIKAPAIKMRISGTTDKLVLQEIHVTVNTRFFVQANLLSLL